MPRKKQQKKKGKGKAVNSFPEDDDVSGGGKDDDDISMHSSELGGPNYKENIDEESVSEEETAEQIQARLEKEFVQQYLQQTKEGRKRAKENLEEDSEASNEDEGESPDKKKRKLTSELKKKSKKKKADESSDDEEAEAMDTGETDEELKRAKFIKEKMEADRVFHPLAHKISSVEDIQKGCVTLKNGHKNSLTVVVISHCNRFVYSADRDGTLVKWCALTGRRLFRAEAGQRKTIHPFHTCNITGLDCTRDDSLLVSADIVGRILVWETDSMRKRHKEMRKSRFGVTALRCHRYEQIAYSGHANGAIFIWSLPLACALQELWDHDGPVTSLDVCDPDRLISSSSDSRVVHWKIAENTFGMFRHKDRPTLSIESVTKLGAKVFIAGDTENSLSVWQIHRATARQVITPAHPSTSQSQQWISSLASVRNSDLVVSGAGNGEVRLWRLKLNGESVRGPILLGDHNVKLDLLKAIPLDGYVNSLSISDDGRLLAAAVGRDYRQTRILPTLKGVRPSIHLFHLFPETNVV